MAVQADSGADTIRCVVCQENIRRGAKVCTHCGSAQDFTRHLVRWSSIAAAVIGVGSLASGAYSLWKLVPSPAKIEAVVLHCQKDSVRLALMNVGDKPGAVRSVVLQVESATGKSSPIDLTPDRADEKLIFEPGKSGTVDYVFRAGNAQSLIPGHSGASPCRYVLSIGAVNFSGRTTPSTAECACPSS